MKKTKKDKNNYTKEYVQKNRTFPVRNTVFLVIIVVLQTFLVFMAFTADPPDPQDIIKKYTVTVEPTENGSLDITYSFVWQAVDFGEELTWVEIGMPNEHFTIYPDSVSSTVSSYQKIAEDDYTALRLDFKNSYVDGEIVEFSFKINQNKMLCQKEGRYFYEFVPGWFNSIPVEAYEFKWKQSEHCLQTNAHRSIDGYHVWQGTLDCGGYEKMQVHYDNTIFENCETVTYTHFNDSDAYNDLIAVKRAGMAVAFIIAGVLFVPMVYIIDCYVSYNRGRGFLSSYGYRIHTYGRKNTHYIRARSAHTSTYHGGGGGRGCACACACACAGGGRAGCSQKDTYTNIPFQKKNP